ncbi:DUF536 domain-containing protein [uncultured Secundilactobacillus sp.]|uniref:DUF536 domain-containing protein n=1 Tax=uncultured Secundilactobacillus sp. TaxID=2813935 RepID=UPI002585B28C|nr:DUF536 domain-containing protein [uncultured Secundilactobacillus sp.]
MSKSVKELAEEFEVSKQAIRKLFTGNFRDNHVTTVTTNGRKKLVVDEAGYELIKSHFKRGNQGQPTATTVTSNVGGNVTGNLVGELQKRVTSQQKELDTKNEQLNEKDTQIKELHKLLDQSQQLQLMAENKIQQLEDKSNDEAGEVKEKETPTEPVVDESPTKKDERGLWSRLFKGRP